MIFLFQYCLFRYLVGIPEISNVAYMQIAGKMMDVTEKRRRLYAGVTEKRRCLHAGVTEK